MRLRDGDQDPDDRARAAAVDAALAGEPVDAELDELARLALALRAERPVPADARSRTARRACARRAFAARGRTTASAGGAGAAASARALEAAHRRRWRSDRCACLHRRRPRSSPRACSRAAAEAAERSGGAGRSPRRRAASPLRGRDRARARPPRRPRRAQRRRRVSATARANSRRRRLRASRRPQGRAQAALMLAAAARRVEDVADGVIRVDRPLRRLRAELHRSRAATERRPAPRSTCASRRPAQAALADLSELAHVRSRTQSTHDITARSRLRAQPRSPTRGRAAGAAAPARARRHAERDGQRPGAAAARQPPDRAARADAAPARATASTSRRSRSRSRPTSRRRRRRRLDARRRASRRACRCSALRSGSLSSCSAGGARAAVALGLVAWPSLGASATPARRASARWTPAHELKISVAAVIPSGCGGIRPRRDRKIRPAISDDLLIAVMRPAARPRSQAERAARLCSF